MENKENTYQKDRERNKKWRENNKDKLREKGRKWRQLNPEYYQNWTKSNPERKREISKKYCDSHKESEKEKRRKWYENNPDYNKTYQKINKEELKKWRSVYVSNRRKNDILYKLKDSIGSLIRSSLRRKGYDKKQRTDKILGCGVVEFKTYLESKFEPWMSWTNKGLYNGELNYGWDIDHIEPTSSAQSEEEIIKLNHYSNLQPLCSKTNRDIKKDS